MADLNPPQDSLKRFSGHPNENWSQFEGLLRASIIVASIPEAQNQPVHYLNLHLDGKALNFDSNLVQAARNDLEQALEQLRNRYAGLDQIRENDFELQNRVFKSENEEALDYLTDLNRLASLTILDNGDAGTIRADERNRRVREQFMGGMSFKYKKVLQSQPLKLMPANTIRTTEFGIYLQIHQIQSTQRAVKS